MKWEARIIKREGKSRIAVVFDENADLIARIKRVVGARWSEGEDFRFQI